WKYTATIMSRTEVLEIGISQLRSNPELLKTISEYFPQFSEADDQPPGPPPDRRRVEAAGKEIETGIVDGTNLLVMDMDLCIGCGDCATQCPFNAISMVPRKPAVPTKPGLGGILKSWLSLAPPTEPLPVTETADLLAVKCNLCENTSLNPKGAKTRAYSCQEN